MKSIISFILVAIVFLLSCSTNEHKQVSSKEITIKEPSRGVIVDSAIVVTAHPLATKVGYDILKRGGNAFEAAIAVQFALAVVYPRAGNIGGGGFMVFRTNTGKKGTLDFREKAPILSTRTMYQDEKGNVIPKKSEIGIYSVGVPGVVDGMSKIYNKFHGDIEWRDLVDPSILLARNGFSLSKREANILNRYRELFDTISKGKNHVYYPKEVVKERDSLKNIHLSETLSRIAADGRKGFYQGETASLLLSEIEKRNGIITQKDLDEYQAIWRNPIEKKIKGYTIISMPPPSSGGIAVTQLLYGAMALGLDTLAHNSENYIHYMTELQRRVYADRATHLGDPDFFDVPVKQLLSDVYMNERFKDISLSRTASSDIKEGEVTHIESHETTHFSIVDKYGNAVAITTTLNGNFGSKVVVDGAGFLLNNEMDDFSAKTGVPNQFGLVGGDANAIAPQKRMLSSMAPTIIEKEGELLMVLGTPGGSTIITNVFQTAFNVIGKGMSMQEAVNMPKTHSQWMPDKLYLEEPLMKDTLMVKALEKKGHDIHSWESIGHMKGILFLEDGKIEGAPDTLRGDDQALGF